MVFSFAVMAAGGVLLFRGVSVIGCQSVSFSRHFTTCYQNDLGALPGHIAGGALIAVGVILFFAAMTRFATVR